MAPMSIERAVENAVVSTNMEGFNVGEDQKKLIVKILKGEITLEEALTSVNEKYE